MYIFGIANNKIDDGYYTIKIWHENTGNEINYKGPYSICNNFRFLNKYNPHNTSSECPYFGPFVGQVSRPLFREDPGVHEITVKIFDNKNNELVCVDSPFIVKKNMGPFKKTTLTKENGSIQEILKNK
jgi:hypothetical protein